MAAHSTTSSSGTNTALKRKLKAVIKEAVYATVIRNAIVNEQQEQEQKQADNEPEYLKLRKVLQSSTSYDKRASELLLSLNNKYVDWYGAETTSGVFQIGVKGNKYTFRVEKASSGGVLPHLIRNPFDTFPERPSESALIRGGIESLYITTTGGELLATFHNAFHNGKIVGSFKVAPK